ncbi:hypothetical protein GLOIN_2v1633352 [Rhizophagus irregularis DAOM 181602=DAOM 197198]|uniref:Uncharacterized protein n=1 Tax=Rhizophagus irregularis (strain DAOM 181602 / DAOM 197198 / MUCL 43194) TaxID=747089 RepID=A0A2P4PTL5_RHIID|nr:hypothetical protein GLOIN_2v1633352 [Rhizophagus irregularis DAOM 181602=DAOM 197198]POG68725.1 hypothetical protein GLOIN_2v1633352 [Rhizophagus irregularis DAOM 181602=DAOM 197198]GET51791.1 hypothetical protein GLOIN_2v1633352 [Rhizophagus irregularis DAOM 181602=DAOM 197198]|eukprot:XP_025175591.1 hypothetical protein GLOIN_2v1633352 [Rhizophagus irregularis DAOM 181602=DAOM 197198]
MHYALCVMRYALYVLEIRICIIYVNYAQPEPKRNQEIIIKRFMSDEINNNTITIIYLLYLSIMYVLKDYFNQPKDKLKTNK